MDPQANLHKADAYSFGVVLFELLSGTLPYKGMFPEQILFMVAKGMLRPDLSRMCACE